MKFLCTSSQELCSFVSRPPCDYAILSYTPIQPDGIDKARKSTNPDSQADKYSSRNVEQACRFAKSHHIGYIWSVGLCVDKSSWAEAVEAALASFRLVWDAALCIAHILDLEPSGGNSDDAELESRLSNCGWFSHVWTLQDLVASSCLVVFDRDWNLCATKSSSAPEPLLKMLNRVSSVDSAVLADRAKLSVTSLGRRLSWAARRHSDRPEDAAYALAGLCGVAGRLIPAYGEGGRNAFHRLQRVILEHTADLSVLASKRYPTTCADGEKVGWKEHQHQPLAGNFSGILADSPAEFSHFGSDPAWAAPFASDCELSFTNRGLLVRSPVSVSLDQSRGSERKVLFLPLNAHWRPQAKTVHVAIVLHEAAPGVFVRANSRELVRGPLRALPGRVALARFSVPLDLNDSETCRRYLQNTCYGREAYEADDAIPAPPPTPPKSRQSKRSIDDISDSDHGDDDSTNIRSFPPPEKPSRLPGQGNIHSHLPVLVAECLAVWEHEKAAETSRLAASAMPSPRGAMTSAVPVGPLPHRPHKRARSSQPKHQAAEPGSGGARGSVNKGNNGGGLGAADSSARTGSSSGGAAGVSTVFACPYYRNDPVRNHGCIGEPTLTDVARVREHVLRSHRVPIHCPICYLNDFETQADRDKHIVSRTCKTRAAPPEGLMVGATADQVAELASWEEGGVSTRSAGAPLWRRIWTTLFPGQPQPESVYAAGALEKEAAALRRFWNENGLKLIREGLERQGLLRPGDKAQKEEASLAKLQASVLAGIMEASGLTTISAERQVQF